MRTPQPLGGAILIGDASVCQPSHGGLCGGNGSAALLHALDASSYGAVALPTEDTDPRASDSSARDSRSRCRHRRGAGFELAYGPALDDAADVEPAPSAAARGVAVRFEEWPRRSCS